MRTSSDPSTGNTFLIHSTDAPTDVGAQVGLDTAPLPYQGISAVTHVAFLLLCASLPSTAGSLTLESSTERNRFVQAMVTPEQTEPEKTPSWTETSGGESSSKRDGEETASGDEEAERRNREMAVEGPPERRETTLEKRRDREVARRSGLMTELRDGSMTNAFAEATDAVGDDAIEALGGMEGASKGPSRGFGGLGLEGAGRGGGGGISESGVGIGEPDSELGGRGDDYGRGAQNLGGKGETQAVVVPAPIEATEALDKRIIRRVVRQHRREIKYCYEKELTANPQLRGQVTVEFTISSTGDVIAAVVTKSTLDNAAVETCVQNKIQHWQFPEPQGNGIVKVDYPFNFSTKQ